MMSGAYVDGRSAYTIHECMPCVEHVALCQHCQESLWEWGAEEGYVQECMREAEKERKAQDE